MKKEFQGRVALVTGGSRGIGRSICVALAREGADIAVNYQSSEAEALTTKALVEKENVRVCLVPGDVSDPTSVGDVVGRVRNCLGPIGLLAANSGLVRVERHEELTWDSWRRQLAVNLDGVFLTTMAVKDEMLASRFGRIVCTSSIVGLRPRSDLIAYATAKAGVMAFVRNCSAAFAPHVRVNSVAPGLTDTDIGRLWSPAQREAVVSQTPLGRIGTPEEVAEIVVFLMSERSRFVTGQTIISDGGRVTLP